MNHCCCLRVILNSIKTGRHSQTLRIGNLMFHLRPVRPMSNWTLPRASHYHSRIRTARNQQSLLLNGGSIHWNPSVSRRIASQFWVTPIRWAQQDASKPQGQAPDDPQRLRRPELSDLRAPRKANIAPMSWKSFALGLVLGGIMLGFFMRAKWKRDKELARQRYRQLGKSLIGGDWELVDHNGNPRSTKDFLGQWYLIYFGFTHCPDVCPEEIEKLVEVVNLSEKDANCPNVKGLVFTVDPERDNVAAMKKYVSEFSPKLIGFTGTQEQVEKVCKTFRVYHSQGPRDEDNDYIVDHTIIHYLMNPDGKFVDYFGQTKSAEDIVASIALAEMQYKYAKE